MMSDYISGDGDGEEHGDDGVNDDDVNLSSGDSNTDDSTSVSGDSIVMVYQKYQW